MTLDVATDVLCIPVAGVVAQWLAWRLGLPAIVLLFAVGLTLGPGLQVLQPAAAFGEAAIRPLVGLAVAIVVFEGGLALNVRELRASGEGVLRLTVLALPVSFGMGSFTAHFVAGLSWGSSLLFGAITVVTGPTVVLPMLRQTRLERRISSLLKWEAIVNDPVGALLASVVLAVLLAGGGKAELGAGVLALHLGLGLALALGLGVGAALGVKWLFTRDQMPEVLKTPMLLALALGVYVVSNLGTDEAGLAAATVFGVALANLQIPGIRELARFKEALVVLIVAVLFIVLTANLERGVLAQVSLPIIGLTTAMLFVVRPVSTMLATVGTRLSWRERALAAWIAPRGIVAAAVAGVASTRLVGSGAYPDAGLVMPAVFALIAATMILHGFTLRPLARRLGLTLGDAPGLAIVGATDWTTHLAEVLTRGGVPTLLVDTYPGALDAARARKLDALQAELLSAHGEESLAERRIDYILAATRNDVYNSLICARLAPELGRHRVFQLGPAGRELNTWTGLSREWRGEVLGDPPVSFEDMRRNFRAGWRFRVIDAAEDSGVAEPDTLEVPLIAIRKGRGLAVISAENVASVEGKSRLLVFAPPASQSKQPRPRAPADIAAGTAE